MHSNLAVLVFMPPAGSSAAETWMADVRRAAAIDLVRRLQSASLENVHVLAGRTEDASVLAAAGARLLPPVPGAFHFGRALARCLQHLGVEQFAYFGGASAPVVSQELLLECADRLAHKPSGFAAVVNNLHSTDWGFFRGSTLVTTLADRLAADNSLGWVLAREGQADVEALEPSTQTRADLDTPTDGLLLAGHPGLGDQLRAVLDLAPQPARSRILRLEHVLTTPGSTIAMIGRVSAHIWSELNRRTSVWVRVFAEERGMVASGRWAAGAVRSLLAEAVQEWGAAGLLTRLASMSQAVLWDTRVWMATVGWPSEADRFAGDLGWTEQIHDPRMKELVTASQDSPVPVVLGGHGVVGGSLYAVLERLGRGSPGAESEAITSP